MTPPLTGQRSRSELIAELYERHAAGLFAYCHDQLGETNSAADAVVAVFTTVPTYEPPARAALYALARREIYRRDVSYALPAVDSVADPATALIERVFRDIRPHQREVLLLSQVCGLTASELSLVLDVAVDTAEELTAGARRRFVQTLETAVAAARSAPFVPASVTEVYDAIGVAPISDVLARLPWRRPAASVRDRVLSALPYEEAAPAPGQATASGLAVKRLWPTTPTWPLPLSDPDQVTNTCVVKADAIAQGGSRRKAKHEATTEPMPRLRGSLLASLADGRSRRKRAARPAQRAEAALAAPVPEAQAAPAEDAAPAPVRPASVTEATTETFDAFRPAEPADPFDAFRPIEPPATPSLSAGSSASDLPAPSFSAPSFSAPGPTGPASGSFDAFRAAEPPAAHLTGPAAGSFDAFSPAEPPTAPGLPASGPADSFDAFRISEPPIAPGFAFDAFGPAEPSAAPSPALDAFRAPQPPAAAVPPPASHAGPATGPIEAVRTQAPLPSGGLPVEAPAETTAEVPAVADVPVAPVPARPRADTRQASAGTRHGGAKRTSAKRTGTKHTGTKHTGKSGGAGGRRGRDRHYDWLWEVGGFLICLIIALIVFFTVPTIVMH